MAIKTEKERKKCSESGKCRQRQRENERINCVQWDEVRADLQKTVLRIGEKKVKDIW